MIIELQEVELEEKEILKNLLEKYEYEFSQWTNKEVNKLGLYGYEYLDYYWTEKRRYPFFIMVDGQLAGFVMINDFPEADEEVDYVISEFFVMYKYIRLGVGRVAAFKAFDSFSGRWQLKRHPKNKASVCFWDKVVKEYTKGDFRLIEGYKDTEYEDGTLGDVFFFDNRKVKG